MSTWKIRGGRPLSGRISIQGSKNAVLPMIAASVLHNGYVELNNVPMIQDVFVMADILREIGSEVVIGDNRLMITSCRQPVGGLYTDKVKQLRASALFLGPLLAASGRAELAQPGGCNIGNRPIDIHLEALNKMGTTYYYEEDKLIAETTGLKGCDLFFKFPSVGATENIMMAAVLAEGITRIYGAAKEPEILDLGFFLSAMGARIRGLGTNCIEITGVSRLKDTCYTVSGDRIAAGTYLCGAAISGGCLRIDGLYTPYVEGILAALRKTGCEISVAGHNNSVSLKAPERLSALEFLKTTPYPGFPTDMQSIFAALLCTAEGVSVIEESIFENRFLVAGELKKMGADIKHEGKRLIINGRPGCFENRESCSVLATDLRSGAALAVAALDSGVTEINNSQHMERGYDNMPGVLTKLGIDIIIKS